MSPTIRRAPPTDSVGGVTSPSPLHPRSVLDTFALKHQSKTSCWVLLLLKLNCVLQRAKQTLGADRLPSHWTSHFNFLTDSVHRETRTDDSIRPGRLDEKPQISYSSVTSHHHAIPLLHHRGRPAHALRYFCTTTFVLGTRSDNL